MDRRKNTAQGRTFPARFDRFQRKSRFMQNKNSVVNVYVENVNKKIHPNTLKAAFMAYGNVKDVYIALKNHKREGKHTTFAFVRFNSPWEAQNAIRRGNGRIMEGFRIRVYEDRSAANKSSKRPNERVKNQTKPAHVHKGYKDQRTFKEALLGVGRRESNRTPDTAKDRTSKERCSDRLVHVIIEEGQCIRPVEPKESLIRVQAEKMEWRKTSLVGNIKNMYNPEMVQEALNSDGMNVKICPWYGLLVVLQFSSEDDMREVWSNRNEMLRLWFDDLERLEGYDGKRKIKTWVVIQDVPLQIWSEDFFKGIARQWGELCEIDKDTKLMNRFDEAKMLVAVKKISAIPDRVKVLVNSVIHEMKISIKEFEEDRRFLDARSPFDGEEDWQTFASGDASRFHEDFIVRQEFENNHYDSDSNEELERVDNNHVVSDIIPEDNNNGPCHLKPVEQSQAQSGCNSGSNPSLVEVPVTDMANLAAQHENLMVAHVAQLTTYGKEAGGSPPLSNNSKLQEVNITEIESTPIPPTSVQFWQMIKSQEMIPKKNAAMRKKKAKSLKNFENSSKAKGRVASERGYVSEAEATVLVGDKLGVKFGVPMASVRRRIEELERDERN
ncbi:hypothetical protein HRI_004965400 [Hibiscus trionum]|uniref:RRM domain-containing protein n=1 Tax=Hibiscus trionum TaxID=183268 RepID=A0A9W7JH19_HIBTR|nr:hypothetical protein HRI_004965400 [Hibiscus trionum]